ncbi:putative leucine-rich repeat-containing protein DDB_G0290503 [Argopecten irradians]|uniref:putative leucine-rich repeat-containing protein DDB_G0290503 n=1 Tax=Argopecten irradians TaxID=31199 RepID=UPI003720905B
MNAQLIYQRQIDVSKLLEKYTPYLRKKIDPLNIIHNLSELSVSDRQQVECQTNQRGGIAGMDKLLDCISKRSRRCFFDFLVILENEKYAEQSQYVIKSANLSSSQELLEARKRHHQLNEAHHMPGNGQHEYHLPGAVHQSVLHMPTYEHSPHTHTYTWPQPYQPTIPIQTGPQFLPGQPCVIPGIPGHGYHPNPDPGKGEINFRGGNSTNKTKYALDIDVTPLNPPDTQVNEEYIESNGMAAQKEYSLIGQGIAEVLRGNSILPEVESRRQLPQHIDHQQRLGIGEMGQNNLRQNFRSAVQDQSQPLNQQVPTNIEGDKAIEDLPDEVFSKLTAVLSRGREEPLWRRVGQKAGLIRKEIRSIENKTNCAEALLDMLNDEKKMTVKQLCDILQELGCNEALHILEGRTELQPNIEAYDNDNVEMDSLNQLGGESPQYEDKTSLDINTKSLEKENQEKVIENVSAPVCREAQEHEQLKCEANLETFSTMSGYSSKSIKNDKYNSMADMSSAEMEPSNEILEAVSDKEKKGSEMDVECLSRDISANLREGNVETTMTSTALSDASNKIQNLNLTDSMGEQPDTNVGQAQGDASFSRSEKPLNHEIVQLQQEIRTQHNSSLDLQQRVQTQHGEVSGIQVQEDANYSRSEKPLNQELLQFQQEIQTQPNLSSFRNLQQSVPTYGSDSVCTLSASQQQRNISSAAASGSEEDKKSDVKSSDISLKGTVDGKSTLSENKTKENIMSEKNQQIPDLAPQELSAAGGRFSDGISGDVTATAVQAEDDELFKQSELPPNIDHQKFQREIETQRSADEESINQSHQIVVSGARPGEGGNSVPHQNSYRDIQNSVPVYRSDDQDHPDASVPRNVDSLVMDEDETFLKETHRQLLHK